MQSIGVLVLVDQDMIEAIANKLGKSGLLHHIRPVQEQVVIIDYVVALLCLHIGAVQGF